MDARQWRRVEDLYHAALEKESGARVAFLREQCQGDEDLLQEVLSLLAQDVSSPSPLDRPAWEGAADPGRAAGQSREHDELIGRVFAHYRVTERLGAGGMGVVYKAEDTILKRTVALKFLSPEAVGYRDVKERLVREAQAAAAFDHPNICHVHGIHEDRGRTFIAMTYVDGPSLADKLEQGPLPLEEAVDIVLHAAAALAEAHAGGIVHRDIKPHNIMLTSKGQVRLMDFGLAKVAGRSKITHSGSTLGTPAYMSPEQLLGEDVDHRTDIWSLGCVLYELLTRKTPFEAEYEQAVAYAIVNTEPAPIASERSDLPPEVDQIVSKALAKSPDRRYQDVAELAADLRGLWPGAASDIARTPVPASGPLTAETPSAPPAAVKISRRTAVLTGSTAALTAAGVGTLYWFASGRRVDSLAILPFALESASTDDEYLAEGLAEGLIANLARSQDLRVLSRDAAFRYEGRDNDARTIAADLGVGAVLKGRLARHGGEMLISAEVIDTADGSVVWSDRFRRPANNLLDVDSEMASAIARRLDLALPDQTPFQPVASPTADPEAYRLYLLGRYHWSRRDDSLFDARDYFQQAVDVDPGYALAWAGLADAYLMLGGWSLLPPGESHPRAALAARRAIELNPTLAEPHATLGYVLVIYERDWTGARREFERAIALDPDYATAHHWFGFYYLTVGDTEQAVAELRTAHDHDPMSPIINIELAYFLFFARRYEECERTARQALQLDPGLGYAYAVLSRSHAIRGLGDEARQAVERSLELTGNSIYGWLFSGQVYAALGDIAGARRMLDNLSAHAEDAYVSPQIPAMIHAGLGENDRAFELFDESVEERSFIASWLRDPLLDEFAEAPRFAELFNRIGLQA